MIQYWIQIPVENAREITERFLYDNLSAYDGYELTYQIDTEAVIVDLADDFVYDFNSIYFGDIIVDSTETDLSLAVTDNITSVLTLTANTNVINSGKYPYVIFNEVFSKPKSNSYFVGYKFAIAAIEPQFSYLLTENSEYLTQEDDSKIIIHG